MKIRNIVWILLYLFIGGVFISQAFPSFGITGGVIMENAFEEYQSWILLLGGLLVIMGAFNHYRLARIKKKKKELSHH